MIQKQIIADWCKTNGFKFVDLGAGKVPCSLDKHYVKEDQTIFISGFFEGSKSIHISRGGLKINLKLKVPIEQIEESEIQKHCLPRDWICPRCNQKSLNLKTDDNHKTYVCPRCYKREE